MQAGIPYTVATGEKLVNETFGPNNIHRRTSGSQQLFPMEVTDARGKKTSLDENGFVFVEHKTAVRDFLDKAELEAVYYPEVSALIKKTSGAKRVQVFDHTADAPRRGAGVQGLRLREGRARALHAAHLVRRPLDAARRAAAPEHRGEGAGLF